jgi:hypothetical protein
MTNRVAVDRPLVVVRSVNGPQFTIIEALRGSGEMRCVDLANEAALVGFTFTNGAATFFASYSRGSGGGVHRSSLSAIVSNRVTVGMYLGMGEERMVELSTIVHLAIAAYNLCVLLQRRLGRLEQCELNTLRWRLSGRAAVWSRAGGKAPLKLAVRGEEARQWWREMLTKLTAPPNCDAVASLQA